MEKSKFSTFSVFDFGLFDLKPHEVGTKMGKSTRPVHWGHAVIT